SRGIRNAGIFAMRVLAFKVECYGFCIALLTP
ncbi:DUF3265 domain-containing protein, partial [Vibrio cholerae O1 biovar El Tor]|nr:DUF3265 domain-containing protein [Vibrio cholerae O1 biovar El Tor]